MPYLVKRRDQELYLSGTKSRKVKRDPDGLVERAHARVFSTESGAKSARGQWAVKWDNDITPFGGLVRDQERYDSMEIVEVSL